MTKETNGMIAIKCIFEEGSVVSKVLIAPAPLLDDFFSRNGLEKNRQIINGVTVYAVTCTQKQAHIISDAIVPPRQIGSMLITACRNALRSEREYCLAAHSRKNLVMDWLFININGTDFFNPKNLPADEFASEYVKIVNSLVGKGVIDES